MFSALRRVYRFLQSHVTSPSIVQQEQKQSPSPSPSSNSSSTSPNISSSSTSTSPSTSRPSFSPFPPSSFPLSPMLPVVRSTGPPPTRPTTVPLSLRLSEYEKCTVLAAKSLEEMRRFAYIQERMKIFNPMYTELVKTLKGIDHEIIDRVYMSKKSADHLYSTFIQLSHDCYIRLCRVIPAWQNVFTADQKSIYLSMSAAFTYYEAREKEIAPSGAPLDESKMWKLQIIRELLSEWKCLFSYRMVSTQWKELLEELIYIGDYTFFDESKETGGPPMLPESTSAFLSLCCQEILTVDSKTKPTHYDWNSEEKSKPSDALKLKVKTKLLICKNDPTGAKEKKEVERKEKMKIIMREEERKWEEGVGKGRGMGKRQGQGNGALGAENKEEGKGEEKEEKEENDNGIDKKDLEISSIFRVFSSPSTSLLPINDVEIALSCMGITLPSSSLPSSPLTLKQFKALASSLSSSSPSSPSSSSSSSSPDSSAEEKELSVLMDKVSKWKKEEQSSWSAKNRRKELFSK